MSVKSFIIKKGLAQVRATSANMCVLIIGALDLGILISREILHNKL